MTPFKTPVCVLDRDLTHFKTLGKSGNKVSRKLTPFKTPDIRTGRVHFKTFNDWVKARKMKSDTVLKDVPSFISGKTEENWQRSYPSRRQPNSRQTKRNGDQTSRSSHIEERSPWETTTVEESPPWNIEGSPPWSKTECPPSYRGNRRQAMAREGKIRS